MAIYCHPGLDPGSIQIDSPVKGTIARFRGNDKYWIVTPDKESGEYAPSGGGLWRDDIWF